MLANVSDVYCVCEMSKCDDEKEARRNIYGILTHGRTIYIYIYIYKNRPSCTARPTT